MSDQQSIRPFLAALEKDGELVRVSKPVDREFEISAFLSAADARPALLFEAVAGLPLRGAGNLLNGRGRIAAPPGLGAGDIVPRLHQAIRAPLNPVKVAHGRVQKLA